MSGRRLPRSFYEQGAEALAPALLGQTLCHRAPDGRVQRVRVTETEAYVGEHDLACHASKGRTQRTEVIFGPPGRAYVYLVYGIHDLLNVVCAPEDDAQAVLIRGAEPLAGVAGRTDGPGRLTRTLGITVAGHNRLDLLGDRLWFEEAPPVPETSIERTPRIGVDYAGAWAKAPLRFVAPDDPSFRRR